MIDANLPAGGSRTARAWLPCALAAALVAGGLLTSAAWAEPVYAPAPSPPAQPPPGVPNTRLSQTRINAGHGIAQFTFAGVGAVSGFECVLVKQVKRRRRHDKTHRHHPPRHHKRIALAARKRPSFKLCGSPRAYRGLESGRYLFKARAYGPGGLDGSPARLKFTITRGSRRQ